MTNRFIALLLILAGLVTPMHKDVLSLTDKTVMGLFLGFGILMLLFSFQKKQEKDEIYRCQLQFDGIQLFDDSGLPSLKEGQRLYVRPYSGPLKEEIHILTGEGEFVAKIPEEQRNDVLYKIEKHSPVHLTIKSLQLDSHSPAYSLFVEMMY